MKKPSKPILRNFSNHHIVILLAFLVKKTQLQRLQLYI